MRSFIAIAELCTGCRMCELACSLEKNGTINPSLARVRVAPRPGQAFGWAPAICRHCRPTPCRDACPFPGAMLWDETLGVASSPLGGGTGGVPVGKARAQVPGGRIGPECRPGALRDIHHAKRREVQIGASVGRW